MMYIAQGDEVVAVKGPLENSELNTIKYIVFTKLGQVLKLEVNLTMSQSVSTQIS